VHFSGNHGGFPYYCLINSKLNMFRRSLKVAEAQDTDTSSTNLDFEF
jgi:hypothetical protein